MAGGVSHLPLQIGEVIEPSLMVSHQAQLLGHVIELEQDLLELPANLLDVGQLDIVKFVLAEDVLTGPFELLA